MTTLETTPLLASTTTSTDRIFKRDALGWALVVIGTSLVIGSVLQSLVHIPLSVFSWHPVFMSVFFVSLIGGIVTLQPATTAEQKTRGLTRHVAWQLTAVTSGVLGFSAIFYNKELGKKAHFTSAHGQLGVLVLVLLVTQGVFGASIALRANGKPFWKHHRVSGYVLLTTLLVTVSLGLQADYIVENATWPRALPLAFAFCALTLTGIVLRVRSYKLQGKVIQQ
ncbi:eukaryotic cytochrome b561-domain-containing protein [Gongronella butleri]|nr:eukaryotic cytochrome b561-domain-containing protein [Gongronella butleri]